MENFDRDLAQLVSYLTFDGHLSQDLKCFYLCSKNKETLLNFKNLVYRKFCILGRFENNIEYSSAYKYRVFSRNICKFLKEIGVPEGDKVVKSFLVPNWIKENDDFAREYLRTAFDCEGSIWFEKQPKIRFGIYKIEEKLTNGLEFIKELREMLYKFNVNSSAAWLIKGNIRKDGKITKGIYFKIKQDSLLDFARNIGFNDRFKNERLILMRGLRLSKHGSFILKA